VRDEGAYGCAVSRACANLNLGLHLVLLYHTTMPYAAEAH